MKKALVFVLALSMLLLAFGCSSPVQNPYEVDEDKVKTMSDMPPLEFPDSQYVQTITHGDYEYLIVPEDDGYTDLFRHNPADVNSLELLSNSLHSFVFDLVTDDAVFLLMEDDPTDDVYMADYLMKFDLETGEAKRCDTLMHSLMLADDCIFGIQYHVGEDNTVNQFSVYKQPLDSDTATLLCTIDRNFTPPEAQEDPLVNSWFGRIYMKLLEDGNLYTYECDYSRNVNTGVFRIDVETGEFQKMSDGGVPYKVENGILYLGFTVR